MNQTTTSGVDNLKEAQERAMAIRPKVGGFPDIDRGDGREQV